MKKLILLTIFVTLIMAGCASVPRGGENLPSFSLNGTSYFPVSTLCTLRSIDMQVDTFSGTVILSKASHNVKFRLGDTFVLADGRQMNLNYPIDIYQGAIVAPYQFKDKVIDDIFRVYQPGRQLALPELDIKKVVVDAGHGGSDPGAIGRSGLREKDVNLDIAKRLSNLLRAEGVNVVMTRSSDRFIPLDTRVEIANNSEADLFISVHSNANRVRSLSGFEVYYVSPSVSDVKRAYQSARSSRLNLNSSYFASRSTDLKAILWDMIYTDSRARSIDLSRYLCRSIDSGLQCRILGVKGARYAVLRGVHMPAVLIEVGFLSNPSEEKMLKNSYYRQQMAEAIIKGVRDYAKETNLMEASLR